MGKCVLRLRLIALDVGQKTTNLPILLDKMSAPVPIFLMSVIVMAISSSGQESAIDGSFFSRPQTAVPVRPTGTSPRRVPFTNVRPVFGTFQNRNRDFLRFGFNDIVQTTSNTTPRRVSVTASTLTKPVRFTTGSDRLTLQPMAELGRTAPTKRASFVGSSTPSQSTRSSSSELEMEIQNANLPSSTEPNSEEEEDIENMTSSMKGEAELVNRIENEDKGPSSNTRQPNMALTLIRWVLVYQKTLRFFDRKTFDRSHPRFIFLIEVFLVVNS